MKKIILLFAMLLTMVSTLKADKYINLENPSSCTNCTWNAELKQLTVSASDNAIIFPVSNVDDYTSIDVFIKAFTTANVRIELIGKGHYYAFNHTGNVDTPASNAFGSTGIKSMSANKVSDIGSITGIRIYTGGNSGTITIPFIVFKGATEAVSNTTNLYASEQFSFNAGTASDWRSSVTAFPMAFSNGGVIAGNTNTNYQIDVTNYKRLYFNVPTVTTVGNNDKGGYIRAFVQKTGSESSSPTQLYAHKVGEEVSDWAKENGVKESGLYYIDLTGVHYLNGIKLGTQNSPVFTINAVYLAKTTLTITDGKDLGEIVNDPLGAFVAYDRSFTTDKISTICLPFALSSKEVSATGGKFYEFESATADQLKFSEVSETSAYTPYLFVAGSNTTPFSSLTDKEIVASEGATTTVTKNGFSFIGTLAKTDISSGAYGFNDGVLKKAGTGVTIKAFRGYFTGAFSGARSLDIDLGDESVTGISKIQTETSNDAPIYNLNGQRVGTDYKGIVIQNGKKVIKK